jgi:hypothetical protein
MNMCNSRTHDFFRRYSECVQQHHVVHVPGQARPAALRCHRGAGRLATSARRRRHRQRRHSPACSPVCNLCNLCNLCQPPDKKSAEPTEPAEPHEDVRDSKQPYQTRTWLRASEGVSVSRPRRQDDKKPKTMTSTITVHQRSESLHDVGVMMSVEMTSKSSHHL